MATYSDFEVLTESYKEVSGHQILTNTLLPKSAPEGKHPLIINWHGGALFTGHREFAPFMNAWLSQWADTHSAIIITSDYRLLPEANASDILSDLRSLWDWVHSSTLLSVIQRHFKSSKHTVDLTRIALVGGSAGGYCAIQQALDHPDEVRAVLLAYPLLDLESDFMAKGIGATKILGMTPMPKAAVQEQLRNLRLGAVVTVGGFERSPLGVGVYAGGLLPQVMGYVEDVIPFRRIREGAKLPQKVLLIQGKADTAIPYEGSEAFAKLVRECCPDIEVRDEYFEGMEYGFDSDATLDDKWVADGLKWVEDIWLAI